MSAYFLEKYADHPLEITLFEATHRIGGKVSTQQFKSAPVTYEAGAAELYDYSHLDTDSLKELIFELGLPIQLMGGSAVIMNDRLLSNVEDIRDNFGSNVLNSLLHFHRIAKDEITPFEFYNSDYPEGVPVPPPARNFEHFLNDCTVPESKSFIENLIHSDLATEGAHTSITYGLQNYLMNDPTYMRLYCIEGGNEKLTQALAERINATIRLQTSVLSISKSATGRIIIESSHQDSKRFDEFDYVIVALPHNHIKSIE
jgi:protoporphyrinogen oxidase